MHRRRSACGVSSALIGHCSAPPPNPLAELDRTVAAAEASLREGELQQAESLYRSALFDAWMMLGHLHMAAAKMADARARIRSRLALHRRSRSPHCRRSPSSTCRPVGRPTPSTVLTRLAGRHQKDVGAAAAARTGPDGQRAAAGSGAGVRDGAGDRPEGSRAGVPPRLRLLAGHESSTRPSGCSPR